VDEVLLHELIHGLRRMSGLAIEPRSQMARYDNADEFFAIMVTNYYSAERGLPMRQSHHGNAPMPTGTSTWPAGHPRRQEYCDLIARFGREHPDLARTLVTTNSVQSVWNPITICGGVP
jgi:hypothetical protein